MTETPLYFPNRGYALFGVLHQPAATSARTPFVFCHPFAEEKLWAQRIYVSFARQLARDGYPVLRFDCAGNGDSEGDLRQSSVETILSDVRAAIDYVRGATPSKAVNLLGLRLGATFAALIAEELPDVSRLILWDPVVDGARYMHEVLRANLTTQMAVHKEIRQDREALVGLMQRGEAVNVEGYELTLPLYRGVSSIKLNAGAKQYAGACLVVQIDRRPSSSVPPELAQLVASYPRAQLSSVQEDPFWKEIAKFYRQAPNLFAVTRQWIGVPDGELIVSRPKQVTHAG